MITEQQCEQLEKIIDYTFKEKDMLKTALTHSSYANECRIKRISDNERLEFLGDAVLELISSEFLYQTYPKKDEGALTKMRASLVCEQSLAYCARKLHFGEYIQLGKGERLSGGGDRDSITSDAFESVIGAIFLDGGFECAKKFVVTNVLTNVEQTQLFHDSKTVLQEIIQGNDLEPLKYEVIEEKGPSHCKEFLVAAFIGNEQIGAGKGRTKKAAEQEAAYKAIMNLKKEGKYHTTGES